METYIIVCLNLVAFVIGFLMGMQVKKTALEEEIKYG